MVAGAATKCSITTQPGGAVDNVVFTQQPVIQLRDVSDNAVSQASVNVVATKASGSGTLGGTTTVATNGSGVATFTNLKITGTGNHTITFTPTGLTPVTSATFNVSASGPPGVFANEPSGFTVLINRPFGSLVGNTDDSGPADWWYQPGGAGVIVTDQTTEPVSPNTALKCTVQASGNGGAYQETCTLSSPTEWFLGYTFKLDPDWVGHTSGVLKTLWIGGAPDQLITKADGNYPNLVFQITTEMNTPPTGTNNFAAVAINRGQWYTVEIYAHYPTSHGGNGTITVWIDGVQRFSSNSVAQRSDRKSVV